MHTFEEPHSLLRSESANVSHTMGASFDQENGSLPLGASAGKLVSPRPPISFEEPAEQGMISFGNFRNRLFFVWNIFFIFRSFG